MSTVTRAPLMSLDDALQALLARMTPLTDAESVATFHADGRVLAEDLVSALQVPAFDNSSMDGYAVRRADLLQPGVTLRVSQRIAAGHTGQPLQPGASRPHLHRSPRARRSGRHHHAGASRARAR